MFDHVGAKTPEQARDAFVADTEQDAAANHDQLDELSERMEPSAHRESTDHSRAEATMTSLAAGK